MDLDDLGVILMAFLPRIGSFVNVAQFYHNLCAAERNDCKYGIKLKSKAQRK